MLSKEEALKKAQELSFGNWGMDCEKSVSLKDVNKLIREIYSIKPYKFEDLKVGMWVWDNVECECIRVLKTYITDNYHEYYTSGVRVIRTGYEYNWQEIGFRENRFFPVQNGECGV